MCTLEKRGNVYILTSTGNGEHRLNPTLLDSIRSALSRLRSEPTPLPPFWSPPHTANSSPMATIFRGPDPQHPNPSPYLATGWCHQNCVVPYPITFLFPCQRLQLSLDTRRQGGWSTLCVVIKRRDRGFLYTSELDIGLVVPAWFMALLECKFGDVKARMDVVLKAAKLTAEKGTVDMAVGNAEETVEAAVGLGKEGVFDMRLNLFLFK